MPQHSLKPPPPGSSTNNKSSSSSPAATAAASRISSVGSILDLLPELQVNFLTYLRAYDLASVHQTCRYYRNPGLVHACVEHCATQVYPAKLTAGFAEQPILSKTHAAASSKNTAQEEEAEPERLYTFENLRNMELLVVARVLAQPEPAEGYIVSKSWCKQALKWLELKHEQQTTSAAQQQQQQQQQHQHGKGRKKKLSKKKQRLRNRKLSDVTPPWPNVNSDLLCEHNCLQLSSNSKTTRARRKVMDKQAWKILKKLYPDSTMLKHECMVCAAEARIERKTAADHQEQLRLQRKQPLSDPVIRRFYTRTKGVPQQALRGGGGAGGNSLQEQQQDLEEDSKLPATSSSSSSVCPLLPGRYYVLPRAWCYGWRRYIRTGEGGSCSSNSSSGSNGGHSYPPPDAACLLCDAHRLVLLPPHLEAYLYGEQDQLLSSSNDLGSTAAAPAAASTQAAAATAAANTPRRRRLVPGQAPDNADVQALLAAGLSPVEVRRQLSAMHSMEEQQLPPPPPSPVIIQHPNNNNNQNHPSPSSGLTNNERLDRENHSVVEIVSQTEFQALAGLWDSGNQANLCFGVSFTVTGDGHVEVDMPVCRACDATGRQHLVCRVRNRTIKKRNTAAATDSNASVKQQQQQQQQQQGTNTGNNGSAASGGTNKTPRMPMEYY